MEFLNLQPASAEIFLAATSLVLLLVSAFANEAKTDVPSLVRKLTIFALLISGVLVMINGSVPAYAFASHYVTAPFMVYMKVLIVLGAVGVLLMAKNPLRSDDIDKPELSLLILLSVLGMMLMVSANNLIVLYMGLELQSLPLYVVAAFRRSSSRSSEAGLKYFLLGALSSGLLLYGASLIYGFTGEINYGAIKYALESDVHPGAIIGAVFLICGLAFKISAVPFHMWTPDVYEGSPTIVTAFFAVVPKLAAMALLTRVTYGMLAPVADSWQQVLVALAVLSMLVGAGGAIMQKDIKRLMAYSSIAHMGYALVGLSAATSKGVSALMVYMVIYIISSLGVFSLILSLKCDDQPVQKIADLAGFSRTHPLYAAAMMVFMFSLAGIPPLGGFFGKWFVFSAAVDAGLVPLAVIGVLSSVIGAFYYLRIIKVMYVDDLKKDALDGNIPLINAVIIGGAAVFLILFAFGLGALRETIEATLPFVVLVAE